MRKPNNPYTHSLTEHSFNNCVSYMSNCRKAMNDKQERTQEEAVAECFMALPPKIYLKY